MHEIHAQVAIAKFRAFLHGLDVTRRYAQARQQFPHAEGLGVEVPVRGVHHRDQVRDAALDVGHEVDGHVPRSGEGPGVGGIGVARDLLGVPDPVAVLGEMRRVVKPGGNLVLLNHFRSQRPVVSRLEDLVAPVCTRLGWKSNLPLEPLLEQVGLSPEISTKVNLFNGWRLIKCVNRK